MFFKKHKKGQIVFVETMLVMCLYLCLIGFMIIGFQLFHTKMVFSVASYEGVRTAIAYETDADKAQSLTLTEYYQDYANNGVYDTKEAEQAAKDFILANCVAPSRIENFKCTFENPDNNKIMYKCTCEADVHYLFPLLPPDLGFKSTTGGRIKANSNNVSHISEGFTMARERQYD